MADCPAKKTCVFGLSIGCLCIIMYFEASLLPIENFGSVWYARETRPHHDLNTNRLPMDADLDGVSCVHPLVPYMSRPSNFHFSRMRRRHEATRRRFTVPSRSPSPLLLPYVSTSLLTVQDAASRTANRHN